MWAALLAFIAQKMLFLALHLESGSFPRPLGLKEEQECFERLHGSDAAARADARDTLIRHNLRLVCHIAKKYYAGFSQDQDDLISIGTIGLIKAVDSFDGRRANRFSTYAARCVENEILMNFRSNRKNQNNVSISEPIESGDGSASLTYMDVVGDPRHMDEDFEDKDEAGRMRKLVDAMLTGRDRQIVLLRFGFGGQPPLTQQQVADMLDISRSYVSRLETKALEKLREEFEKGNP